MGRPCPSHPAWQEPPRMTPVDANDLTGSDEGNTGSLIFWFVVIAAIYITSVSYLWRHWHS